MESQSVLRLSDRLLTTASASKIKARSEAITIEAGQLPQEDFLQYGNVEDLLLFQEASQDREVPAQQQPHSTARCSAPPQALTSSAALSLFPPSSAGRPVSAGRSVQSARGGVHRSVSRISPSPAAALSSLRRCSLLPSVCRCQPGLRTSRCLRWGWRRETSLSSTCLWAPSRARWTSQVTSWLQGSWAWPWKDSEVSQHSRHRQQMMAARPAVHRLPPCSLLQWSRSRLPLRCPSLRPRPLLLQRWRRRQRRLHRLGSSLRQRRSDAARSPSSCRSTSRQSCQLSNRSLSLTCHSSLTSAAICCCGAQSRCRHPHLAAGHERHRHCAANAGAASSRLRSSCSGDRSASRSAHAPLPAAA